MADPIQRDFHHPYTPYAIQLEFMNNLYSAIEDGCVGIFESPTGTGKSLSLICGALTWLRDHKNQDLEAQLEAEDEEDDEPAWVREHAKKEKKDRILGQRVELEERLKAIREKEAREKANYRAGVAQNFKKMRKGAEVEIEDDDEEKFILDDYQSDDEFGRRKTASNDPDGFSPAVKELMSKLGMTIPGRAPKAEPEMELPDETKIFFCSRTHSQLTQFVNELRRVKMPSSLPSEDLEDVSEHIKHLSLGSRKNLCINPTVTKLNSVTAINERCLDMQKSSTSGEKRCNFLPTKDQQVLVTDFRDHALATIRDIEDLSKLGKSLGTCPYYATRSAIKPSEIVTLPYPLLLQKSAREALGISLKGHVVVIDEAHNLIDAISSMHSVTVTLTQLNQSVAQLDIYLSKFRNRLKGLNKGYVMQVSRLLDGLATYLDGLSKNGTEGEVQASDLLAAKGIDQINVFKLQKYLTESKLAQKLESYFAHTEQKKAEQLQLRGKSAAGQCKPKDSIPTLTHLQGFLSALTNPSGEGRIFYGRTEAKEAYFKYMLLDPAFHFKDIVEEARAVILAGGTMQPMEDYFAHLFPYLPKEKIRTLTCGHVIPKDNLLAWPMVKGPTGLEFEFTFEKRMDPNIIEELGRTITNICVTIPHGVVCFFPSYSYLSFVAAQWQKKPTGGLSIWERLAQKKQIFQESTEKSSVEETLTAYSQAIDSGKGGLLLSVVGGKMSEGINFNDNLGRGVVVVGLPFPNAQSAEWRAKLKHVENVAYNSFIVETPESQKLAFAKSAGKEFYENACMRAVNQSIGRAIRHREDFAAIILIDKRYATKRIQDKLPGWIKMGLIKIDVAKGEGRRFGDFMKYSGAFFRGKKM